MPCVQTGIMVKHKCFFSVNKQTASHSILQYKNYYNALMFKILQPPITRTRAVIELGLYYYSESCFVVFSTRAKASPAYSSEKKFFSIAVMLLQSAILWAWPVLLVTPPYAKIFSFLVFIRQVTSVSLLFFDIYSQDHTPYDRDILRLSGQSVHRT